MSAQSIPTWYVWLMCCRLCGHVQHKRLTFVVCCLLFVCLFVVCLFVCLQKEKHIHVLNSDVYVWKDWVQMYCMITTQSSCTSHTHTPTHSWSSQLPTHLTSTIHLTRAKHSRSSPSAHPPSTLAPYCSVQHNYCGPLDTTS